MTTVPARRRNRFWLVFPFLLLAAVVTAWTIYWFIARDRLSQGIDDWIAGERARGASVEYAGKTLGGYPFRFELTVKDPVYQPVGAPKWEGEMLRLVMQPWNWQHVIGFAPGRNIVTDAGGLRHVATLGPTSAVSLSWTNDGINRFGLQVDDGTFIVDGETYSARGLSLNLAPRPEEVETLMIAMQWDEVTINGPVAEAEFLGETLGPARLIGEVRAFFPALAMAGGDPAGMRDALTSSDGGVEVAQLLLNWGPLELGAKGDVGFESGKANGAVSFRLDNVPTLRAALEETRTLSMEEQAILAMIEASSRDGGFLKIDIREDALYFGPARIGELP